eukprot:5094199-Pleurochrysis_carterae.AAC.1
MCFGDAPQELKWFGRLVGPTGAEGLRVIGFDNGDLQTCTEAELKGMNESGLVMGMGREELGMAESRIGVPKAAGFTTVHDGGRG